MTISFREWLRQFKNQDVPFGDLWSDATSTKRERFQVDISDSWQGETIESLIEFMVKNEASYQSYSVLYEANEAYRNYLSLEPIKTSKLEELENQFKAKYYAERLQHYTRLSILYK
ncbi:hypothetical protein H6G36_27390 [Anabaena minutissima FACHB-250]|nr:hypothetical protein [Anabaena minutissima FACHB-250]